MTVYQKPPLTFVQQLQQLQDRGLVVRDLESAQRYLQRVGYYRLMGYLFPQRRRQLGTPSPVAVALRLLRHQEKS